jgi:heme iron utilization protein
MPYAADGLGRPLLLISGLAVHTRNLEADPRASLLVADAGPGADPLAAERVTLLGDARRLAAGEVGDARTLYLARHPDAAAWVDFGDFAFWRLEVDQVYMVGGFGVMGWVTAEDYAAAAT